MLWVCLCKSSNPTKKKTIIVKIKSPKPTKKPVQNLILKFWIYLNPSSLSIEYLYGFVSVNQHTLYNILTGGLTHVMGLSLWIKQPNKKTLTVQIKNPNKQPKPTKKQLLLRLKAPNKQPNQQKNQFKISS